jgi:ribosomal protection tetracycline resistance protein
LIQSPRSILARHYTHVRDIPARYIGEYRNDLNFYTNGRSVCLTELKGYQESLGEPVFQTRRPNSRLDKVRHMFNKTI